MSSLLFSFVSSLITVFYLGALQWSTLDSSNSKVDTDEKAKKCSGEDMFMEMLKCPETAEEQWYEKGTQGPGAGRKTCERGRRAVFVGAQRHYETTDAAEKTS